MTLHTCPKCHIPGLYSVELNEDVNCRSCGARFTLSRFTKTEKDALARFVEAAREKAQAARTSRKLIYVVGATAAVLVVWLGISAFGLIPDEWRLIHRRFAGVADQARLTEAVGLVAAGRRDVENGPVFEEYFTAVAISNDGYMLTSREVLRSNPSQIWVFVGGRRLDAQIVDWDKIADFAIIKARGPLGLRFRLAGRRAIPRLNVEVQAIGYGPLEKDIRSPVEWPLAITRGTVSRTFSDDAGTEWIEHSAPIGDRSRGGPLVFGDLLVGLNVGSNAGITRAVAIGPYRETISRMIEEWEKIQRRRLQGS